MVRKVFQLFNKEVRGLHEAAYLLAIFAFLSQILGLVRDRILASQFGAGELLDVYYAAFRIPDLLYVVISTLVSVSVLVPFLVRKIDQSKKELRHFVDNVFSTLIIISLGLLIVAFILTKPLLHYIVPELLDGKYGGQLILMTQILLLQPLFLALSSLFSSVIQAYKKFFVYALSPILYNVGIIIGIVFFYPYFGIIGLVFGVILGALLHLLIQIPVSVNEGIVPRFTFKIDWKTVKEVLLLSIPRTLALTSVQLILIFLVGIAGGMIAGSISVFTFSYNLQSVPMSIIGVSYSLAAFPTLSRLFARGEIETFLQHIVKATQHIIFWSLPVMVMFIVLRAQIVRTILGSGEFDWNDTRLTAAALAIFAVSVLAQNLSLLLVRGYYSVGDTKRPIIVMIISAIITIVSSFLLVSAFKEVEFFRDFIEVLMRVEGLPGTVILMLPLAFSIGQIINAVTLWILFDLQYKCFTRSIGQTFIHSLGASLIMGYVAFIFLNILDSVFDLNTLGGVFLQGFLSGIIGIITGVGVLVLLNNKELNVVWQTLHKKIWKTKLVAVEPEDVS